MGDVNPAEVFTKHVSSADRVEQLGEFFGRAFRDGRPEAAPQLRRDPRTSYTARRAPGY